MPTREHRSARVYVGRGLAIVAGRRGSKAPLVKGGCHAATADLDTIDEWWSRWPDASIILACTEASGLVAIDIDAPDGAIQWAELIAGELPPVPTAHTPGGGVHLLFRRRRWMPYRSRIAPQVEVKHNGSIHVAPSVHPNGGRYRWEPGRRPVIDIAIPMMPEWLVSLCRRPDEPDRRATASVAPSDVDVLTRARAYVARMDPAISGQGGHAATFRVAVALVRGFGLEAEEAMPILRDYSARCDPPWSEKELRHKVRQAQLRGQMPWGSLLRAPRRAA